MRWREKFIIEKMNQHDIETWNSQGWYITKKTSWPVLVNSPIANISVTLQMNEYRNDEQALQLSSALFRDLELSWREDQHGGFTDGRESLKITKN